ncbi:protein-tyrosine-phosphatase PTP1 [Selaginella moellendorffii]|nr:protein-tyrosine-phosphatase PTP1 [Selaginella moellendorffii]|eukprot:XP_002975907.2 protein-tyrosine-phosphatase PTP1 [Selaginella moellendorffii]
MLAWKGHSTWQASIKLRGESVCPRMAMELELRPEQREWCRQASLLLKNKSSHQAKSEYQELVTLQAQELLHSSAADHPHCRSATRVVLQGSSPSFINANFITSNAICGGQPDSPLHFWEMVVQCNCRAIVKLTEDLAGEYFPLRPGESQVYGRIKIINRSSSRSINDVTRRLLQVECDDQSFTLEHWQYSWSDFGVPKRIEPIQEMFAALYKLPPGCSYFIHCRAGIGRAGTFVTLDHVLRSILSGDLSVVNISHTVARLRQQRRGLVETDEQYWFCFRAVIKILEFLMFSAQPKTEVKFFAGTRQVEV